MVLDKRETKKNGGPLTPAKIAIAAAVSLVFLIILQQAGLAPKFGNDLDKLQVQLGETRKAMEAMKALAVNQPWQEAGQCTSDLEKAKNEIEQLKASGGSTSAASTDSDCNAKIAAALQSSSTTTVTTAPGECPRCIPCADLIGCSEEKLAAMNAPNAVIDLQRKLQESEGRHVELMNGYNRLLNEKSKLDTIASVDLSTKSITDDAMAAARKAIEGCSTQKASSHIVDATSKGYLCSATTEEFQRYLNYTVRAPCPDDWFFVQELIYVKNCHALPRRRCLSRTPRTAVDTIPFPRSLWDQEALNDKNVRWDNHHCKSFDCLNTRLQGDCRNCFNLSMEANRWKSVYRGAPKMADVIAMKKGTLRLGLDAGGGTGSFAAHMAGFNVTVLTTAMNVETVFGRYEGMPYMEAIALRGLVPLHVPHAARLPFFDNTLDVVHSVNSIKYLPLQEFEELMMEWDRVLRPGGIMWFEMFYAPVEEMPLYLAIIDLLQYKQIYWNLTPKPDDAERGGAHVYLNCVIEKQARTD